MQSNNRGAHAAYPWEALVALSSLGAQRHLTVQEKQGQVKPRVEGETETFLLRLCVKESHLRIESDRVIGGADVLNESVV